jgi:hypothetical protein
VKKPWHIDYAQMMLIRPGDFDTQNVVREALRQVLNILAIGIGQSHIFSGLFSINNVSLGA